MWVQGSHTADIVSGVLGSGRCLSVLKPCVLDIHDLAAVLNQFGVKVTVHADLPVVQQNQQKQERVRAAAQALRLAKSSGPKAAVKRLKSAAAVKAPRKPRAKKA